jgi:hypothetical protein
MLFLSTFAKEKNRKNHQKIPEDPVFGTRYYLSVFFDGSTWYQLQPKKISKSFFGPQKTGFSTGINTQKKIFFEFFS